MTQHQNKIRHFLTHATFWTRWESKKYKEKDLKLHAIWNEMEAMGEDVDLLIIIFKLVNVVGNIGN